jgi:hypothetical protein
MKLIVAIACTLGMLASAEAQTTKRDLYGFAVDVPFKEAVAHGQGRCRESRQYLTCDRFRGGTIRVQAQEHAEPARVEAITFKFGSGAPPEAMVASVTKLFGREPAPSDLQANIAKAKTWRLTRWGRLRGDEIAPRFRGNEIAKWDLDDGVSMKLWFYSGHKKRVSEYLLELRGSRLEVVDSDAKAAKEATAKAKLKTTNRAPMF